MNKPWFLLDDKNPNPFWWRTTEIVNTTTSKTTKENKDILANIIIQDCDMFGNCWHVSTWYIDDPNRYYTHLNNNSWIFNKPLKEMVVGDIVYFIHHPEIQFNVYNCSFGDIEQQSFCKILERLDTQEKSEKE